jgi:hypothetical protein
MAEAKPVVKAPEKKAAKKVEAELPDTPSGLALAEVGADGDGEEYAKIKRRHRWEPAD